MAPPTGTVPHFLQVAPADAARPAGCTFSITLKGDSIAPNPPGTKRPPSDAQLFCFDTQDAAENSIATDARSYKVHVPASTETLRCSGKQLLTDCKAVLVITGKLLCDPPSLKTILDPPESIQQMGEIFGSVEGMVVKNFLDGMSKNVQGLGGGAYFFNSLEQIDKYLGSELWTQLHGGTEWQDVCYEKYEVVALQC